MAKEWSKGQGRMEAGGARRREWEGGQTSLWVSVSISEKAKSQCLSVNKLCGKVFFVFLLYLVTGSNIIGNILTG